MRRGRIDWLIKRIASAFLTIFLVMTVVFLLQEMMPGDPFSQLSRKMRDPEAKAELQKQFQVGEPIPTRYVAYMGQVLQGNLGISTANLEPVAPQVWEKLKVTLPMVLLGEAFAITLGIITGVIAAARRRTAFDSASTGVALTFYSFPTQWFGLMLILIFSTTLGWFPSSGRLDFFADSSGWGYVGQVLHHMILPALTLGLVLFGEYTILVRSAMLEALGDDFVQTARAKGLSRRRILWRHAFRNASLPIVTLVALSIAYLVSGAVLVEVVFNWPGIGLALQDSISNNDTNMLMGITLMLIIAVVFMNLIADLLYFKLDPRITE